MAYEGMDVDLVESAGRAIRSDSQKLAQLITAIDAQVSRLPSAWEGPDARTFASSTWPQHKRTLLGLVISIDGLGQSALNNAAEQRDASAAQRPSGATSGIAPNVSAGLADGYQALVDGGGLVSKAVDGFKFADVIMNGVPALESLDKIPAWKGFDGALGMFGIATAGIDIGSGIAADDYGKAWGGVVDAGLGVAGVVCGAAATPIIVPLTVAKAFVDATIPYSDESQDSLMNYESGRLFGADTGHLTPDQASQLSDRYSGGFGWINMISDKMDQTAQPISDAGANFGRWMGWRS